jgi:mono/diheme cytochrome c family protein
VSERRPGWIAIGVLAIAIASAAAASGVAVADYRATLGSAQGVADPDRAWQNYLLNCQGCHRPDGTGDGTTAPALAGHVGLFTTVPAGRDYLSRVPGAATAPITDAELAELLNWVLWRFDAAHVAPGFKPYAAAEVGRLRARPLRTEAAAVRARLLASAAAGR